MSEGTAILARKGDYLITSPLADELLNSKSVNMLMWFVQFFLDEK